MRSQRNVQDRVGGPPLCNNFTGVSQFTEAYTSISDRWPSKREYYGSGAPECSPFPQQEEIADRVLTHLALVFMPPTPFTWPPFQGKYAEADLHYIRATDIAETALGPGHPSVALVLNNRALLLESQVM